VRESIVKKAYYSIGEVCDLTGLKPHVLRYWETQFDILRPTKNRAGNRVFRPKDIELVLLVKNLLYEQKYTIEGANQKLLDMRKEGELEGGQHEVLGPEFLSSMKEELESLSRILTPTEPIAFNGAPEKSAPSEKTPDPPVADSGALSPKDPVEASEDEDRGPAQGSLDMLTGPE
jgi:DNA-binding transcriptional MerR regulator